MAVLKLQLLGGFKVTNEAGQEFLISARKGRALLAVLAVSGSVSREKLAALFWSDRGEDQARSSLRQTLTVLRKELGASGANLLIADDQRVELARDTTEIDTVSIISLSKENDAPALRHAANLYQGELLADGEVSDPMFEEWLASERSRFRDLMVSILDRLLTLEPGVDRVALAKRLLALDPLREASHLSLMSAYADNGERSMALQHYSACRDLLKSELGIQPGMEIEELRRNLQSDNVSDRPLVKATPLASGIIRDNKLSIAVLPFTNLDTSQTLQILADGLTEDLITDLSRISGVFVIAAHSIFKYRAIESDIAAIARDLNVRYVVKSSVRQVNDRLRLNAQLIDTESDAIVWAERFDRNLAEVYDLQDAIAAQIAKAMIGPLSQPAFAERYRSTSPEAFDLCMLGRSEWRRSDESGCKANSLFEQVITLDPNYAEAYRWLALGQCLSWLHFNAVMHPTRELAVANARKAVSLDPTDPAAHGVLGFVLMNEAMLDEAEEELQWALRLNPNDADAWFLLSDLRVMEGKGLEAVACSERSLILNPQPWASYYWLLGQAQYAAGQFEAAVKTLRREETHRTGSRRILAAALAELGHIEEARTEGRMFMLANPHFTIDHWVKTQPFRDLKTRDLFVEGYRKAGLPDHSKVG